ncbi:MAG: FAD-dependent oxidoreductase [Anaerolineae bacterium]|nr:FAD-dependent oxidoreductase [Anaerolineae bacterium]
MNTETRAAYPRSPRQHELYDVIVAGGGPAGIGAALGAAIQGARTLVLEARSQFGGTATAALWMEINFLFKDNDETDRGGVHRILVDAIRQWGPDASIPGRRTVRLPGSGGNLNVHPEYLKKVLFDLFDQYGVDYQLYSPVVDVVKEGDTLTGVVVAAKEGRVTFRGRTIIDATGDGDVAYLAGCEMETEGDESTGWRPPVTVAWAVCNVDCDRFFEWLGGDLELVRHQYKTFNDLIQDYRQRGYNLPSWIGFNKTTVPGVVSINNGTSLDLELDCSKSETLTLVEKMAIDQALDFCRFAREKRLPGMENVYLMRTGGYAMARDTRRLVGEYQFGDRDVMEGTGFEDAVASKYGGSDPVGEQRPYLAIKQGALFPYRSLLPRDVEGLLVAGRCSSATMLGHYGGKSMGNMISIGQGAGVAAALCAQLDTLPRQLDFRLIQEKLDEIGVRL